MQSCIRTRSYIGPITPTPNRPFSVPSIWRWSEKSIAIMQHRNYPTRGRFDGPLLLVCSANCEIVRASCYTWVLESDMDCVTFLLLNLIQTRTCFGILGIEIQWFAQHLFWLFFFKKTSRNMYKCQAVSQITYFCTVLDIIVCRKLRWYYAEQITVDVENRLKSLLQCFFP